MRNSNESGVETIILILIVVFIIAMIFGAIVYSIPPWIAGILVFLLPFAFFILRIIPNS